MPPWAIRRVTRKRSARSCPGASGSSARWGCGVPDMMAASIAHYHSTCFLWGLVLRPRDSLRPRQPLTEARGSDSKPEPGAVVIDLSNDPPAEPEAFRLLAPQRGAIATEQKCRAPEHGIVGACSNPPVRKSHRTLLVGALPILPCFTGQQKGGSGGSSDIRSYPLGFEVGDYVELPESPAGSLETTFWEVGIWRNPNPTNKPQG